MTIVLDIKFSLGSIVYLLTDEHQLKRIVTAYKVRSGNYIEYELSCGLDVTYHVETEILTEKQLQF